MENFSHKKNRNTLIVVIIAVVIAVGIFFVKQGLVNFSVAGVTDQSDTRAAGQNASATDQ